MKKTKVFIDTYNYHISVSGVRTYVRELFFAAKFHGSTKYEYVFSHDISQKLNYTSNKSSNFKYFRWLGHLKYFLWKQMILPFMVYFSNSSVLICPDYIAPVICPSKKIVVIHDDLFWNFKSNYSKIWRICFVNLVRLGISKSTLIVTTSKTSKKLLKKIFIKNEIKYAYQCSDLFFSETIKTDVKNNILHVGSFDKRKNILVLAKAFKILVDNDKNYKLILVGKQKINGDDFVLKKISEFIKKNNLENKIILKGYLSVEELKRIYKSSALYVFPSVHEGFGIPIIEAMSMGLPVLCSDIEIFREIGKDSVLYFNKNKPLDLYNKMILILKDKNLRNKLIRKGFKRSKKFNRKNFITEFEKNF